MLTKINLKDVAVLGALLVSSPGVHAEFRLIDDNNVRSQNAELTIEQPSAPTDKAKIAALESNLKHISLLLADTREELERVRSANRANVKQQIAIEEKIENIFVLFAFGSTKFVPPPYILKNLISSAEKATRIDIYGFTDSSGTLTANQRVATARAVSAKKYLMLKGIPGEKMTAIGKAGQYFESNDTEEGRKSNRRVEFNFFN